MFDKELILRDGSADWTSSDLATGASEVKVETGVAINETPVKGLAAVVILPQALIDDGTDTVEAADYAEIRIQESDDDSTYNDLVIFPKVDKDLSAPARVIRRFATTKKYVRVAVEFYNETKTTDCALDLGKVIVLIGSEDWENIPGA